MNIYNYNGHHSGVQKLFHMFRVNPFYIFLILVGLIYIDTSFYDFIDYFGIPIKNEHFDLIFLSLVIIFFYLAITIMQKGNAALPIGNLFRINFNNLKKIIYLSYTVIFTCLLLIVYQVISQNSYNIYLAYLLLFSSHFFALFFSTSGTVKFLQWLRIGREKLSFIYFISFAAFSILICFSLVYDILQVSGAPVNITTTNYQKVLQTTSMDVPQIYKYYISSYIFSFFAIWVSTLFLLHDYISKNFLKFLFIMILPMILFLINLLPITITFIVYLVSIYPFLFPIYTLVSSLTFIIGPIIFSSAIFLMIRDTDNQPFKNYLLPLAYGLFLIFASTQPNLFSRVLYPPFGLISILFSGLSLFLIFTGFYSSSLYITRNHYFAKTFVNRYSQFEFFRNIGKSELEMNVRKVFNNVQKNNIFHLSEKDNIDELNREEVSDLIEFVKKELKGHSNKNNDVDSS
jgi:hypothetical protein